LVLPFSMLHDAFSQVLLKIFLYHPLDLIPLDFLAFAVLPLPQLLSAVLFPFYATNGSGYACAVSKKRFRAV
ncbi:MAG: hypothetical protein KH155_05745, partial [Clostridium sp.]|nr:hypothetical protein [Clostridium sp.]